MLVRNAIVARATVCALLTLSAAGAMAAQTAAHASATTTDARWTPWLGCWQSDTLGAGASGISIPTTCVVPVAGSSSVEALSIVDGQIVSRRPLIADGKPHPMDESGCHGDETANWSPTSRRIYLRANYACTAGLQATSSSVFAIAPNGDWLEVQNVRAGGGSLDRVLRWHDAPSPRGLPKPIAARLVAQRLAITTSRAAVARPLTTDDVIEATRAVDATTVQSWLVATGQHFSLSDAQIATLASANVPPAIVRLMAGVDQSSAATADAIERQRVDDYLNGYSLPEEAYGASTVLPVNPYSAYNGYGSYVPYTPYPAYGYPTYGYDSYGYGAYGYPVPIVVVHGQSRGGVNGIGRGRPIDGGHPNPPGPVGIGRPMMHAPVGRPAGVQPPVSRPPVAHMPEVVHAPASRQPAAAAPARTRP